MTETAHATVATWNVHRCIGRDGRHDPARVGDVIRALDADVVALQEVDSEVTREGFVDQLDELARHTGYRPIAGPTIRRDYGRYGNAVLTRVPVEAVRRHDLSVPGREPRGALDVTCVTGAGRLRVVATHLGLGRRERRYQAGRLLDLTAPAPARSSADALVVAGDVNVWAPFDATLRRLERAWGRSRRVPTFPAGWPVLALDRIWAVGRLRVASLESPRTAVTAAASDHLPLVARLAP